MKKFYFYDSCSYLTRKTKQKLGVLPLFLLFFASPIGFASLTSEDILLMEVPLDECLMPETISDDTDYCIPVFGSPNQNKIESFYTTEGYTNITNLNNAYTEYSNFTNHIVTQSEGGTFNYHLIVQSYTNADLWVDWNNNMVFDEDELVGQHSGASPFTGIITIPENISEGDYRFRVRSRGGGTTTDPCSGIGGGEAEDYTITVVPTPACPPVSGINILYTETNGASIEWVSSGVTFQIAWGEKGFDIEGEDVHIIEDIDETSHILTNLNPFTEYEFYIRQDCTENEDGYSQWSGVHGFTTYAVGQVGLGGLISTQFPILTNNVYNYSQQIYLADEISHTSGENDLFVTHLSIKPMTFPSGGFFEDLTGWTIFLGNITQSSFTSKSDWVPLSDLVQVFSGEVSFDSGPGNWLEIELNTPFVREAGKNLVIAFKKEGTIGGGIQWAAFNPGSGAHRGLAYWNAFNNPDPASPPTALLGPPTAIINIPQVIISAIEVPSCYPITGVTTSNVTNSSVDISWIDNGGVFDIEWGQSGFSIGEGVSSETGLEDSYYTITELQSDISYEYYVRQNCGNGDTSIWSGPHRFYTGYCVASSTQPTYRISGFSTSDGYTNIVNHGNGNENDYSNFMTYKVTQSAGGTFKVSVDIPAFTNAGVWIDWNNNMIFDEDELVTTINNASLGQITIPENTPEGDYRMRVRSSYYTIAPFPCGSSTGGETEDYTVSVVSIPMCNPPSDLAVDVLSFTSVDLSWTSDGNIFNVLVGAPGFTPDNQAGAVLHEVISNFYTLENLDPETFYHFYVQKDCDGTNGESLWAGPYRFYTGYCWPDIINIADGYSIYGFSTTGADINISNLENGGTENYHNYSAYKVILPDGEIFTYTIETEGNTYVDIWVDWNNNMIFEANELIAEHITTVPSGSVVFTGDITVPEGTTEGDYRMRIRARQFFDTGAEPCGTTAYGEVEDYTISVKPIPSCEAPSELDVTMVDFTTAQLSWVSDGDNFEVEYGVPGFNIGQGIKVPGDITTNFIVIEDLFSDNFYQYYVRLDCGDENFSYWAGPYQFYTGYCVATSTSTTSGNHIISFVTLGGLANISNSSGGAISSPGYSDYSTQTIEHFQTGEIEFTATIYNASSIGSGLRIWVDWNNDMAFDQSEIVYTSPNIGEYFSGTIYVPLGIEEGDYRLRIRSQFNTTSIPACGNINSGEVEDYTFRVITPPACLPAFKPIATNISASSVSLSWEADGNTFDIEYGLKGFESGSEDATLIEGVDSPFILSNLQSGQTHEYYVRQDCNASDDGYSDWSDPVEFIPGAFEGSIPTMYNEDPEVEDIACSIPSFTIEVPEGYQITNLKVQYQMISSASAQILHQRSVLYSPTLEMGEAEVAVGDPTNYPGIHNYNRNVQFANGATGSVEFVLKAWRTAGGSGCGEEYVSVTVGSWVLIPTFEIIITCFEPTNLGITNITETSVDLIWTSQEESSFDLEWGTIGFTPGAGDAEGTFYGIEEMSQTINGLDSSESYEFYVRSNCSTDEDMSTWAGPFKFKSGYCEPISNQSRFITLFSTTGAEENITYTGATLPPGSVFGYRDKTDLVIVQQAGESFDFQSNYIGGQSGARIWVDWNKNFVFEDDEEVFYHGGAALKSGTIEIPADILLGDYVIRVYYKSGASSVPTACESVVEGEAVDFTLRISCDEVVTPGGETVQTFTEGQTLADLDVVGDNLIWYADTELTEALESTHELIHQTIYYVTTINEDNCQSEALAITVIDVCADFVAPVAETEQNFTQGQTLADLEVTGTGLVWYADAELIEELESTHELIHAATYYVVATNDNCQSEALAITVTDICADFVTPVGETNQTFTEGQTLASLDVTGVGLAWYADAELTEVVEATHELVHGTTYYVVTTNDDCQSEALAVTVSDVCFDFAAPVAEANQTFTEGQTLADLDVTGTGLVWYADAELAEVLEPTHELVHGITYYVVATNDDCQSEALAITVEEEVGITSFGRYAFKYYPNPVSQVLDLRSNTAISEVVVFNMLGQQLNLPIQPDNSQIDMTELPAGNYFISVTIEGVNRIFKVVKQ